MTDAAKVYLFFLSGAKKGRIEVSDARIVRIGRQPYCEIQLDPYQDIPASGEHAKIVCQPDGMFTLFDSNSSWGTYKNDARLTGPVALTTGDVITFGVDESGRQGPRVKFYLETDILRCPACTGPVYKRHFKCPSCKKKTCLRCIDFAAKVCTPCSERRAASAPAASAGYEIVEDDVVAQTPARVVISGKDAQRVRRAQAKQKKKKKASKRHAAAKKKIKLTRVMPGARGKKGAPPGLDPGIVAEPVDVARPFCMVCCEFVARPTFHCPSCDKDCCEQHRTGRVCPSCAGMSGEALTSSAFKAGRGTEPELMIPDLADLESAARALRQTPAPRRPALGSGGGTHGSGSRSGSSAGSGSGSAHFAKGRPVGGSGFGSGSSAGSGSGSAHFAKGRPVGGSGFGSGSSAGSGSGSARSPGNGESYLPPRSKIQARAPTTIPCERSGCLSPLDAQSYFICTGCRLRLCPSHRVQPERCDSCVSSASAAPLPPTLAPPPMRPSPIPATLRFAPSGPGGSSSGSPLPLREAPTNDSSEMETLHDDVPSPWGKQARAADSSVPGTSDLISSNPELEKVKFECPYCEGQLPAHARRCHHCKKDL